MSMLAGDRDICAAHEQGRMPRIGLRNLSFAVPRLRCAS
jgi:hypothetical protein